MTEIQIDRIISCPKDGEDIAVHVCEECEFHDGYSDSETIECTYGEERVEENQK